MNLFKPKPQKVMLTREQVTISNLIQLAASGKLSEVNSLVLLELLRQLDERINKLETKKK
jgi:hypothetical protein